MKVRVWVASAVLLLAVIGTGGALALWKWSALRAAAHQPHFEPSEVVTSAVAQEREHRRTTTSIGTVLARQSITLRNEVAGTVREVGLVPGSVVEPGTLLVALDVSVEEAELAAQEAQARFADAEFKRIEGLMQDNVAVPLEVDRARADRDIAHAQVERIKAVIAKKTIRAPFRAKVGMADISVGQYLEEGTQLTTLQGVDDAVHVDFTVTQAVAQTLREGDQVEIFSNLAEDGAAAEVIAIDARVDATTRNAWVRARLGSSAAPPPGASVRVRVPVGEARKVVAVPVSALRKGPQGDHVFVIQPDGEGRKRAHLRLVEAGAMLGNDVLIYTGLKPGEQVAAAGSFKLREGVLVMVSEGTAVKANPGQ